MSDYHILNSDEYGNRFRVVMHFPVADQVNDAAYPYRTAIVEWQGGVPIRSILPNPGTEQAQLDAGELYERQYEFSSHPGETLAQKRAKLDDWYTLNAVLIQAELVKVLGFWGYERDVP
jgi:hypothetical protein